MGTGALCYELRGNGLSWKAVGAETNMEATAATSAARYYALKNGLLLPKIGHGFPRKPLRKGTRGERAYQLRGQGLSWEQITERIGGTTSTVMTLAHGFARVRDLEWPVNPRREQARDLGEDAYQRASSLDPQDR